MEVSFLYSNTCWASQLVDQRVLEGTCSQVLRSTSVDAFWEHQNFLCLKLIEIVIVGINYTIPFGFSLFLAYFGYHFSNFFVWLRINDEGSVSEMSIWSISLIKSDLKWCINLSRSLFVFPCQYGDRWYPCITRAHETHKILHKDDLLLTT